MQAQSAVEVLEPDLKVDEASPFRITVEQLEEALEERMLPDRRNDQRKPSWDGADRRISPRRKGELAEK